jgi:hypothetical protein
LFDFIYNSTKKYLLGFPYFRRKYDAYASINIKLEKTTIPAKDRHPGECRGQSFSSWRSATPGFSLPPE